MGFIVAAVGAIASAISGVASFVAGLGALGSALVTIGLNVAVGYITKKLSKKKQEQAGGVQIERQYGADVSRQVAMGLVGVAGHDCYINTYGSSNKFLQQIYAISDFYTTALNRIAINGSWVGLGSTPDPQKGFPVTTGDFAGYIWVKFIDGRQTTADNYLVDNSNPSGRWTADHVGLGMSYILVSMTFDKEKNNQFPDFFFEFQGAPLYDWRKDSSVGGSGSHRWNDVSTWEFSENPIVMSYNYRRGLSINNDMFCGMGMAASDLPLDKWTVAANLCDETKADGFPAYRCSIMIDCMQTHGTTIEALGVSCAALHVDGVSGSWPIVGSAQPTVVTITDADLVDVITAPVSFRARRSMADLVNSVSGNFPDPDSLWSMIGYQSQISQAGLVLDRRTRDVNIDFPQVRHSRQAASLAWIYLYENRFEANAQITLRAKHRGLEPGDWIRWTSARYGDRVYVVTDASLKSLEDDQAPRCVQVSLQERDGSIYDNVSPPPIVVPFPPGLPQYLQEVQNLQVLPIYMLGDSGILVPAIRVSWSVIEDETVSDVLIRYWPTEQPENVVVTRANGRLVVPLLEGVVGSTEYQVQTRLETDPARVTAWTAPQTVVTYAGEEDSPVDWEQIAEDVQSAIEFATDNTRELISWSQNLQASFSDMQLSQYIDMQTIRRELSSSVGRASARFIEEITVATGPNSAIVQSLTQLQAELADKADAEVVELMQAKVDEIDGEVNALATALIQVNASADGQVSSGLFRMTAQAGSGGFTTRIAMFARSGTAAAYQQAGMFINVSPSQSQIMFLASQFIIADPTNYASVVAPFVVQGGIVYMQSVRLGTLQFDELRSNNGKLIIRGSGSFADIRIFT